MHLSHLLLLLLTAFACQLPVVAHAEKAPSEENFADQLPRITPLDPGPALGSFEVLPGFKIEQVAAEPLVRDPVALDFDENGRLFVVEMCDYSEQDQDFLGRIRLLEDTDGDGRFDKSTVYAEKLSWPTAVICFDGGIFVGAAPDIFYLKDGDGDGKAEHRRTVFTGFRRHNVQGLLNSFRWGLDNRIHGATGTAGGTVTIVDRPDAKPIDLGGRDFSFDPRRLDLRPESGGGQHGMSFDDWGRKFVCNNSEHLQMVLYEDRYSARQPLVQFPPARRTIAVDGGQAEVYRLSPVEPWRILRTRLRVEGRVSGGVEGGGRPAGYFTGATGVTIYRGNAFPDEYRGQAFTGDVGSNLIHRKVLEPNGVALLGCRVDPEREFVASRDIWFRPAQFANAPDGTFYIADVYREVIEHPHSIPPEIKQHLDLASGTDRGRIYRVVPDGFKQPALPRLGEATLAQLVATLEHRNGWHRDTAARLLYQRSDTKAEPLVRRLLENSELPEGRVHALYVLQSLGALKATDVQARLVDPQPRVREHAIRLSEQFLAGSPALCEKLCTMTVDDDVRVRLQLAFSLADVPATLAVPALARLALGNPDGLIRAAVVGSIGVSGEGLAALLSNPDVREAETGRKLLEEVAEQFGAGADRNALVAFDAGLAQHQNLETSLLRATGRGMIAGVRRRADGLGENVATALPQTAAIVAALLEDSKTAALDPSVSLEVRQRAVGDLTLGEYSAVSETLASLLASQQPQDVQLAAIAVMGRFADAGVANCILEAWPGLTPRVRQAGGELLASRATWLIALLDAVEAGNIAVTELDAAQFKQFMTHKDPEVRQRAEPLFARLQFGRREDVLQAYRPALEQSGDAARGKAVFQKSCSSCHRLEGVGHEIGPKLAAIKARGAEAILFNVLDPNREVNPQFVNYTVLTVDGRSLGGLIANESAGSITLRRAENATDTIARSEIDEFRSTGQSIMPEGMEKQIDLAAMADLIAYLMTVDERNVDAPVSP